MEARKLELFVQVPAKRAVVMDDARVEDYAYLHTLSLEK
jgi:hypothetical protein